MQKFLDIRNCRTLVNGSDVVCAKLKNSGKKIIAKKVFEETPYNKKDSPLFFYS